MIVQHQQVPLPPRTGELALLTNRLHHREFGRIDLDAVAISCMGRWCGTVFGCKRVLDPSSQRMPVVSLIELGRLARQRMFNNGGAHDRGF